MKNRKTLFVSKGDVMKFQVKTSQVKSSNVLDFPVSAKTLLKYAMPTMLSSLFMNIYSLVDAFFVANWVGTDHSPCHTPCNPPTPGRRYLFP